MTAVGFEPTPLRTGALSQRLRPLGQTVLSAYQLLLSLEAKQAKTKKTVEARGVTNVLCLRKLVTLASRNCFLSSVG